MTSYADHEEVIEVDTAPLPRVCLLTETFHPVVGGGETHARLLASRLNRMGMSVFVLTRLTDSSLPKHDTIEGTPVHRVPPPGMKRIGKYLMLLPTLMELARRKHDYDLIFVCGFRTLGLPAMLAADWYNKTCVLRAEVLGELSGGYAAAYRKRKTPADFLFRKWIDVRNRLLKRADGFVAISTPIAEEFTECGVQPAGIFRIPNGIDLQNFTPVSSDQKKEFRRKLNLPEQSLIVSYSGKLNKGKGLEYLLQAWKILVSRHSNLFLVLIGSGKGQTLSVETELRKFVGRNKLGRSISFTGYTDKVNEYLQASDMFILPSENESFGLSLVEAMACRLPVIATNVGGIPEIVTDYENGLLINPADSQAITYAIEKLMDPGLARNIADNGYNTVRRQYSIEVVAEMYYELFTTLHDIKLSHDRIRTGGY